MVAELLGKYIWLIRTFLSAGEEGLPLSEICAKWERRWDSKYTRRSFNNHRLAIEEVFNIKISYSRRRNCYYIDKPYDVTDSEDNISWLVSSFTVNSILSMGSERLSGRISLEKIPSGEIYLTPIMEAMTDNSEIEISYRKYTSDKEERLTIRPYAVKEYRRIWYLIGYCIERKAERVYSLDRIVDLKMTGKAFRMPEDFDIDLLMGSNYGMYLNPELPTENIIFCATDMESKFLNDLPIHPSQKELDHQQHGELLQNAPEGMTHLFSIRVKINKDLIMELSRRGSRIKILSPASLAESVAEEHRAALQLYNQNHY